MLAREASTRTYNHIGVPDPHHAISHHGNDPSKIVRVEKINAYHVSLFSRFVDKLQATPDGDGTLLDHSLLMYGGGIGNGNLHQHQDLPCLLVGGAGGRLKGGRHIVYPEKTPLTNALLSILDKVDVHRDSVGDSTGRLDHV